jgi:ankyrin repeat protein
VRFPILALVALLAAALPAAAARTSQVDGTVLASPRVRAAVIRALPLMQRSAAIFVDKRNCISCHHNALSVMMLRLADRRGIRVDPRVLDAVESHTFRELRSETSIDDAIQGVTLSDPTPNDSFVLMAAHAAGMARDLQTAIYARRLLHWQRADGRWITSDFRPPHSSSQFTATASAALALRAYLPDEIAADRDAALRRAVAWLTSTWPRSTEDAAFRVLGLVWAGAPTDAIASASRVLLSLQLPDGGWPQLPDYAADAYSTGEALYALNAAGVSPSTREWQRGQQFLLSTQAADGSWHVRTRMISPADISPPYFHTGFPYGKDEFLSYAGSAWAVMALLSALPETPATIAPPAAAAAPAPPSWLRTVLFAPAPDLDAALDAGLDPNSRTAGGTTLLMAAALDGDKTRALLARGADPHVRGKLGIDALTIAASHVGTSGSVRALLDAGAEPQAPDGVRVRRAPIVAASMAGDVDTVKLLLDRGAKPSGEAVSEAVTFGHADVVAALVAAGGDASGVDRTGINLLHWATITNRASVIPVLAKAGVPINAIDDAGFTPLMYAATVDQGDDETLEALLRAGASARIRNDQGRTPLQQAERLKHRRVVKALRDR